MPANAHPQATCVNCLGPLAAHTRATFRQHILIWSAVVFFNLGAVALEGAYFAPDLVPLPIPVLAAQMFLAALAVGWLITLLFAKRNQSAPMLETFSRRPWAFVDLAFSARQRFSICSLEC